MSGDASSRRGDRSRPDSADDSLALDTALELLANRRRRYALYALRAAARGVVAFDDLIGDVVALECDRVSGEVPAAYWADVESDLDHWHLPILEEVGVVEYDDRSDIVRYVTDPTLERWATLVRDEELAG